jgi:hypothetical protein
LIIDLSLESAESVIEPLKEVKKIDSHVCKFSIATDLLQDLPRAEAANETRWNSQLKMVRRVANFDKVPLGFIPRDTLLQNSLF